MKRCLLICLTGMLLWSAAAEVMAAAPQVGVFDMRLLVVLHPRMATFDFMQGRFFRPRPQAEKHKSVAKALREAHVGLEGRLGRTTSEIKRLRRSQEALAKRRDETLNSLLENAKQGVGRDFSANFQQYRDRYQKLLTENEQKLIAAEAEERKLQDQAYSPIYLNEQESIAVLQQIQREIQQQLEIVVRETGLTMVIDPTLNRFAPPADKIAPVRTEPAPPFDLGCQLIQNLQTPEDYPQGTIPGPNGQPINAARHVAFARGQSLIDSVRKYLNLASYLSLARQDLPLPPVAVLVGAADITATVAQRVFQANRVSREQQARMLKLLNSYNTAEAQNQIW